MKAFVILPIHLFEDIEHLKNKDYDEIFLIEEYIHFRYLPYHKLKLAFHRATMKMYYDYLKKKKINVTYIDAFDKKSFKKYEIYMMNPADHLIINRWKKECKKLNTIATKSFLISEEEILERENENFTHDTFYKFMRKKLDVLMDKNKPEGGKWSFDKENRKSMSKNTKVPELDLTNNNEYTREAIKYVKNKFKNNYGDLPEDFPYPTTHSRVKKWLKEFIKERFNKFGDYQDFVSNKHPFMFHSVISPFLNVGMITDKEVLEETKKAKVDINDKEGFLRQLIGWRQYVYTVYMNKGQKMRQMNFFKAKMKLPEKIWLGETKIKPIDDIIKKLNQYAYSHHIERLMWLGAFFLLLGVKPIDVNDWFMVMHIDSYDVFMIPNIFGMTQHADGGEMMTRPYFSSSNYLLKMSDYKKNDGEKLKLGKEEYNWAEIWDSLYYDFISQHKKYLEKNYSTARQVYHWNNKNKKEQSKIKKIAKLYKNYLKN
ncbi:MAG: hypothetical protein CMF62_04180 [Magnetococcales bacterium]|nr:hypothetical protein [Magnetococcales bacterium]|tara:strand:- start:30352 stop:31806 length:1455 start_codon:yes stop_codon:yes gene_type:complete